MIQLCPFCGAPLEDPEPVELRPDKNVQEQESEEPRLTQAHNLVAFGVHQTVKVGGKK